MQKITILWLRSLFVLTSISCAYSQTLPVITNPFAELDAHSTPQDYASVARKLFVKNLDLRSSELYLYASLLYCKGNQPDSAGVAMLAALASGMANPNILDKDPSLSRIRQSEQWPTIETKLDEIQKRQHKVANFRVNTDLLASFFTAYNQTMEEQDTTCRRFHAWVLNGPDALRDFYFHRYESVDRMCRVMVKEEPEHYHYLQQVYEAGKFDGIKKQCEDMIRRFAKRYPPGTYPTVYIVPGLLNMGGSVTNLGLYIGADKFVEPDTTSSGMSEAVEEKMITAMKGTIFHELMHFQQHYRDTVNVNNILGKVIYEGVCDFLVQLFTGQDIHQIQDPFLEDPQVLKQVLTELQQDRDSQDLGRWVYNSATEDRPKDVGYKIGAEVCRSYYNQHSDKDQAIYELLNTSDITELYRKSKYAWVLDD